MIAWPWIFKRLGNRGTTLTLLEHGNGMRSPNMKTESKLDNTGMWITHIVVSYVRVNVHTLDGRILFLLHCFGCLFCYHALGFFIVICFLPCSRILFMWCFLIFHDLFVSLALKGFYYQQCIPTKSIFLPFFHFFFLPNNFV